MKNSYRLFFAECQEFVKIAYFLRLVGIPQSTFSMFMKSDAYDYMISLERLRDLEYSIRSRFSDFVE